MLTLRLISMGLSGALICTQPVRAMPEAIAAPLTAISHIPDLSFLITTLSLLAAFRRLNRRLAFRNRIRIGRHHPPHRRTHIRERRCRIQQAPERRPDLDVEPEG